MNSSLLFAVLFMVTMLRCGVGPTAGGSTDTELGGVVVGMVVDGQGHPSLHTRVSLIPQQYNPVTGAPLPDKFTDTTDSAGGYEFENVPAGGYSVVAVHQASNRKLLISGIAIDSGVTEMVDSDTLRPTGSIAIEFPESPTAPNGYVYIPGTMFFSPVKRQVVIDGIPPGRIPSVWYADTVDLSKNYAVGSDVTVNSEDTVYITDYHAWRRSAQVYLNTSSTGADVAGDVEEFPVLIRLSADNFPFSEAQGRGADLRFSKSDGGPLPFEIELWDSANGAAVVWVKVDTVYGNDSTRSIMMYWGADNVSGGSVGASVFDTANGFTGVWHLGENSGSAVDATGNRFDGSRNGNPRRTAGAIGYGQFFDGVGDYFEMGNTGNPGTSGFTVSAWIKLSAVNSYRSIIAKSPGGSASSTYGWLVELGDDGAFAAFAATDSGRWGSVRTYTSGSNVYIKDTTDWHFVTAVFDRSGNTNSRLYIDGSYVPPFRGGGDIASLGPIVNSVPLRLGMDASGGNPWKGVIDECTFALTTRSSDWVKLCYMNQKTDDKLVVLRINK